MKTFDDFNNSFDELAAAIHRSCVDAGWWDDMNRCIYQTLQLVVTEMAEATEGERKGLMDDHLPHRKMGEVELADALIRLLDMAGRYGWRHLPGLLHDKRVDMVNSIAGKHLAVVTRVADMVHAYEQTLNVAFSYTLAINNIMRIGELMGYDIMGALFEKWEYNKHRADHKPENRAKVGGKKF